MKLRQPRTALLFVAACAAAFGDTQVVPNAQATASGNSPITPQGNPTRIQEIVGTGQFPGPITITALALRSASGTGLVYFNAPSWQLTLSTTQAYPNTNNGHALPSVTYADNVGPDATMVYNGTLSAASAGCQSPGPCPFDLVVSFTTPFTYDPSQGRLLIDMVVSVPTVTFVGSLDGQGFPDATTSTVATITGDPTQPTGTLGLGGLVYGLQSGTSTYYFPHFTFGGGFQSTLSYVNYAPQGTSCQTTFYDGTGASLAVPFDGGPVATETDILASGAVLRQETTADPSLSGPQTSGWAVAVCRSPVKASMLYRAYNQGMVQGETEVSAATTAATQFVTFARDSTAIAFTNPNPPGTPASITVTALSAEGFPLGTSTFPLAGHAHTVDTAGDILGLGSFTGSVQITSTVPILSQSFDVAALPVFSALPPGDLPPSTPLAGH